MKFDKIIETKRLKIGPLVNSDAAALLNIYANREAMKYRASSPLESIEGAEQMISEQLFEDENSFKIRLGIRRKSNQALLGTLLLTTNKENNECCEIGFSFGESFWGNGYAQETLKAVERELSDSEEIKELRAWSVKENLASLHIFTKAKFHIVEQNKYPLSILFKKRMAQ